LFHHRGRGEAGIREQGLERRGAREQEGGDCEYEAKSECVEVGGASEVRAHISGRSAGGMLEVQPDSTLMKQRVFDCFAAGDKFCPRIADRLCR